MRIEDKDIVWNAMKEAIEAKKDLWSKAKRKEEGDLPSQFAVMADEIYEIPAPMLDMFHETIGSMTETLEYALFTEAKDGGTLMEAVSGEITSCMIFFEAYHRRVDRDSGLSSGEIDSPDELEQSYRLDPASDVKEALIVLGAFPDSAGGAEMFQLITPFGVGDGGVLSFEETVEIEDDSIRGGTPDIMRQVVKGRVR